MVYIIEVRAMYNETKTKQELIRLNHLARQIPKMSTPEDRIKAVIDLSHEIKIFNNHTDRYKIRYERGEIK